MLTSKELNSRSYWLRWCRSVRTKYAIKAADYPVANDSINAYHLIPELILNSKSNSIFVCGDATACIVPFQTAHLKEEMNMFSNSGCASMGYDLPAAIGAAQANPNRPVVCFAGDGSLMMNIQELQTLASSKLNILLVILDNGGYLSIKQTQLNFFGRLHGATPESGISFPHFDKVCRAFGLPTKKLNPKNWREEAMSFLSMSKPRVLVAKLNKDQEFIPRIKSKIVNGLIQTPTLEDMYPHLDTEELQAVMNGVKL
jgi:acetolactate synthase-1/2/3 large subunit